MVVVVVIVLVLPGSQPLCRQVSCFCCCYCPCFFRGTAVNGGRLAVVAVVVIVLVLSGSQPLMVAG